MRERTDNHEHDHHVVSYRTFILVWIGLLILTVLTVYVATLSLGAANVVVALAVASAKAALVIFFFMHLKYEQPLFKLFFLIALVVLAIFIGFTFFDVLYR